MIRAFNLPIGGVTMRGFVAALFVAVFAVATAASGAMAEMITLKAELSGASEVPPNDAKAVGTVAATYDTDTKTLTYEATFSDLTGPAIGAHFHGPTDPGANAGIAVPFLFVMSPVKGKSTLTDAQAADLLAGKWYANIHTQAHPGGEIRGQLVK
jgi:hypothetical protein